MGNDMFHGDYWMWGMHAGWWFFLLIVLIGVFWIFSASRRADRGPQSSDPASPLDILKRRYAEGEISTEEYEERKRNLEQD
jgi:putative membrane protein